MMQRPVVLLGISKMSEKEYRRLEEASREPYFNVGDVLEFMAEVSNSEVVKEIFCQLREMLNWGYLLELFHRTQVEGEREAVKNLVRMARDGKGDLLADEIYRIYRQVFHSEAEFVRKYGIPVELEI